MASVCNSSLLSLSPTFSGSVLQHYESELQRLRAEYAGFSGTKREELETLLMQGDLLEVTLDEIQQLWQLLQSDLEYLTAYERNGKEEMEVEDGEEEEVSEVKEEQVCLVP